MIPDQLDHLTKACSQAHGLQLLEICLAPRGVNTSSPIENNSTRDRHVFKLQLKQLPHLDVLVDFLLPGTSVLCDCDFPFRPQFEGHPSWKSVWAETLSSYHLARSQGSVNTCVVLERNRNEDQLTPYKAQFGQKLEVCAPSVKRVCPKHTAATFARSLFFCRGGFPEVSSQGHGRGASDQQSNPLVKSLTLYSEGSR